MFTDVRQRLESQAIRNIVSNFADPAIGCVSGALHFVPIDDASGPIHGDQVKMHLENKVRKWEGMTGSTIWALGAFYAVRKDALTRLPKGTILDDCYIPLETIRQGFRSIFDETACAWDDLQPTSSQEFARNVRTITGIYQLIRLSPWLIRPTSPVFWAFFSHKVLRLVMPFAHLVALLSAALITQRFYEIAFTAQVFFFLLAAVAKFVPPSSIFVKPVNIALSVWLLNTAAAVALYKFLTGKTIEWAGPTGQVGPVQGF